MILSENSLNRFSLEELQELWGDRESLKGVILFGSRAREDSTLESDWDIGIIHSRDRMPDFTRSGWDLFFWSEGRWKNGFALQLELAREGLILYDPEGIALRRLVFLKTHVLPRWEGILKRI